MDPSEYGTLEGSPPSQTRQFVARLFQKPPPLLPGRDGAAAAAAAPASGPNSTRGPGPAAAEESSGFGPRKRHFDGGRQFANAWNFLRLPTAAGGAGATTAGAVATGESGSAGNNKNNAAALSPSPLQQQEQQPQKQRPKFRAGWQAKRRVPGARAAQTTAFVTSAAAASEAAGAALPAPGPAPAAGPGGRLREMLNSGQRRPRARGAGAPRALFNPISWASNTRLADPLLEAPPGGGCGGDEGYGL